MSNEDLIKSAIIAKKSVEDLKNSEFKVQVTNDVTIDNFDVIKKYLRDELSSALKPVIKKLDSLNSSIQESGIEEVKVSNLSDIVIPEVKIPEQKEPPESVKISQESLDELRRYFMKLGDVIKTYFNIEIPQPVVNVSAPVVNVPEQKPPVINFPTDLLTEILGGLAPLQRFFNDDEAPFVVKFSDTDQFVQSFKEYVDKSTRKLVAISSGPGAVQLRNIAGNIINPATDGGPVTISGQPIAIKGNTAEGAAVTGTQPVVIAFKDIFGNTAIPTGINAGGLNVLGTVPVDLSLDIQNFLTTGEALSLCAATANSAATAAYMQIDSNRNLQIVGSIAHDGVDSGNPVKVGGKAADYTPTTSDQPSANKTAVAAADRTDGAYNLFGEEVEGVNPYFFTLNNVSTTYNNTTTTATSTAKNCWNYRQASFSYELTKANSPTDILFEIEVSLDGTNYTTQQNDFLGDLRESAASVGSGIKKSVTFPIAAQKIRVKATATGTSSTATFTVANAVLYLRN